MWDFTLVKFYCQILFKKKNKKYKKNQRFFLGRVGPKVTSARYSKNNLLDTRYG